MQISIPNCKEFCRGIEEYEKHEKRDAMYKVATFLVSHSWGKPSDMANGLGVLLLTWNQSFYRYGIFDFDKLEHFVTANLQEIESFRNKDIAGLSSSDEEDIKDLFTKLLEALQIDVIRFSDKNTGKYSKHNLEIFLKQFNIEFVATNLTTLYKSIKNSRIDNAVDFIVGPKKDSIEITISELDSDDQQKLYSLDKKMKMIKRSPVSVSKALHLLAPDFFPLWDDRISRAYGCYYNENPAQRYISFCKDTKVIADKVKECDIRLDKTLIKLIDQYNYSKYTKKWI